MPILLVGQDYWTRVVNLDYLIEQGFADPLDRTLLQIVETGAEAARFILEHCR